MFLAKISEMKNVGKDGEYNVYEVTSNSSFTFTNPLLRDYGEYILRIYEEYTDKKFPIGKLVAQPYKLKLYTEFELNSDNINKFRSEIEELCKHTNDSRILRYKSLLKKYFLSREGCIIMLCSIVYK